MSSPASGAAHPPATTPEQIRRATVTLLASTGLCISEEPGVLVITNLGNPSTGRVFVSLADGFAWHERTETEYWGHLEGIITGHDHEHAADMRPVPAAQIIAALAPERPAITS